MSKSEDYIYAVARIRCKEGKLFSSKNLEQMISMKDAQSVKRYLSENGWSLSSGAEDSDALTEEEKSVWVLMKDLVGDLSCFDFLRVQSDFQNLKACIKSVYSACDPTPMFVQGGTVDPAIIYKSVSDKSYGDLPDYLSGAADEAMSTLLRTGDGQLCDILIDKACLNKVYSLGKVSADEIIREYCEVFVASANIRMAVRGVKLCKSADFFMRTMAECDSLNLKSLAVAAAKGFDEICSYLSSTDYKSAVSSIKDSLTSFEKWCDNYIMQKLRSQKSDPFSIGPLVAYIIARQTEIKAVRLILTAKINDLEDSIIRERIRDMYV
ncbi:MAG: V-type ATPase subunit [Ruminococcus sp.]|nr:V-type ATPase subunit [Ruminococcus sp.]